MIGLPFDPNAFVEACAWRQRRKRRPYARAIENTALLAAVVAAWAVIAYFGGWGAVHGGMP